MPYRALEVTPMALLAQAKQSLLKHLGKHLDVRLVAASIYKYYLMRAHFMVYYLTYRIAMCCQAQDVLE
jgi:hypothetical protein